MNNDKHLCGQQRPTVEQIAWVFAHLDDALREPGTFRFLINERLGCGLGAYQPLYEAGGMNITNAFCDLEELRSEHERGAGG